jgi:hypothetical protein
LNAIHIASNDGVTYVNVYRRSLSSSLDTCETQVLKLKSSSDRDSQGLRRPRFSFFILTCQTARVRKPHSRRGSIFSRSPPEGVFRRPHSTANDNRLSPAVDSLIEMRSFTGTKPCLGSGPKQRRAQWPGYRPLRSELSTPHVKKSSHRSTESRRAKKSRFLGALRRT